MSSDGSSGARLDDGFGEGRGILETFARQRDACADAGSPFYATLLAGCIADLEAGGPVAQVMAGVELDPNGTAPALLPLRFLGGVHRLVLAREAPLLALHYPSVGGDGDASSCWPAFRACVASNIDRLRADLLTPPQTNDVGRAALLIGALHLLAAGHGMPIRLFEIGASAGLNLMADAFAVTDADGHVLAGPPDAGVVLRAAWEGSVPPAADVRIVERLGCDLAPVDISTVEGRERLTSFVWPDDLDRFERLRAALAVAAEQRVVVERSDAVDFVDRITLKPGTVTVLWHSVVAMYMDREVRRRLTESIERLRGESDVSSVFAHVWFEPRRQDHVRFVLRMQEGGDDVERIIGESPPHGLPVTWL